MLLDRWVEFVLKITFSITANGSVTLWRRNEGEQYFRQSIDIQNVPTLQTVPNTPVGNHYWKQGFYRDKDPHRVDQFLMGPMVRAGSFSDVEKAAFGTNFGVSPNERFQVETKNQISKNSKKAKFEVIVV